MSRKGVMSVLDKLEGLMAEYVIDFKEESIRNKNDSQNSGSDCIEWRKCPLILRLPFASLFDGRVVLNEEDANASLRKITISDVDAESLLLQPDNFSIRYFKSGMYGKASDYLLFTRFNLEYYAIFIELKSKIYEKPRAEKYFEFQTPKNRAIMWQMIGADALLDSFIDILAKQQLKVNSSISTHRKSIANNDLVKFKRRYIVLYKDVDETGVAQPRLSMLPNHNALQKPVHALKVVNNEEFSLSHLFYEGGLEV